MGSFTVIAIDLAKSINNKDPDAAGKVKMLLMCVRALAISASHARPLKTELDRLEKIVAVKRSDTAFRQLFNEARYSIDDAVSLASYHRSIDDARNLPVSFLLV